MSSRGRALDNWERLVNAVQKNGVFTRTVVETIELILEAADEIEDDDLNVARILCEQTYTMTQNLDSSSEHGSMMQFRAGLKSVIKQKKQKKQARGTGQINREHDKENLWRFYLNYKKRLEKMHMEQREAETFSSNIDEKFSGNIWGTIKKFGFKKEIRTMEMKEVYVTLRALLDALEVLVEDSTDDLVTEIMNEVRRIKRSGEELISLTRAVDFFLNKSDAVHQNSQQVALKQDLEATKKLVHELQLECAELELHQLSCMEFTYSELKEATNNFDESLKIGAGGFSTVFKGFLRHTHVAIKILKKQGNQHDMRGFDQEVETLSKVRHPNLVTLIGACKDKESPALVFEFLTNGSLENHLNKENVTPPLSGETRIRIALEISSALNFLHSTSIAHGDLKPGNILLDSNYVSKLGDFGTARQLVYDKNTITPYHLTENVKGTIAYMDLDHLSGRLTPQSDVYSFGVVLLQLATGKDAIVETTNGRTMLSELVETAIEKNTFDKLIDVEWPSKEAPRKMAELGLCCIEKKRNRPNAAKVYKSLMDIANAI